MALQEFNQSPYFDDYDANDQYLKILFRPGHPVQTRELNQLQTMLQKQVERFGDHIFENGSRVLNGGIELDKDYFYIKLTEDLDDADDDTYIGRQISNTSNNLTAKIVNVVRAESGDPTTLYVKYTNSSDTDTETFDADDVLEIDLPSINEEVTVASGSDAVGKGVAVNVNDGIYYAYGYFHVVTEQTLILEKYGQVDDQSEISIGLYLTDSILTPEEEPDLRDNAQGTTNFAAPGAHRYKIKPTLVLGADFTDDENYIEVLNIQFGNIAKKARVTEYSVLEQTLARRTYDESGDYVIRDFGLSLREHLREDDNDGYYDETQGGDESKIAVVLNSGKAYVRGFEIETTVPTVLETDKARSTRTVEDILIPMQLGNYLIVDSVHKMPDLFDDVGLYSDTPASPGTEPSTQIGTAKIRNFVYDLATAKFKVYLFDMSFTSGAISSVKSFYQSTNNFTAEVAAESENSQGNTFLTRTSEKTSIYEIPFGVVNNVSAGFFSFYRNFASTEIVAGEVDLTISSGTQFRDETTDYQIETESGVVDFPQSVTVDPGNTSVTLDVSNIIGNGDANNGENVRVLARVTRTTGQIKSKTPSQKTFVASSGSLDVVQLDRPDVFQLVSVVDNATETVDYTDRYLMKTGQRDSFYDLGSIELVEGATEPTEDIKITFKFYAHGTGDYFVAQSYTDNGIDYTDIPVYETADGRQYPLANCIDFRPTIQNDGTGFTSSSIAYDPDNEIISDFDYYLSRIDKVILDKNGNFKVVSGSPDVNPEAPKDRDAAITLYQLDFPAYTFRPRDIGVGKRDHRRYTMNDIGEIERRVENLEYYTLLSLLEADTLNRQFPDKFKSGFVVDNFETQTIGDSKNTEHKIAIDFEKTEARPEASTKSINLEYDTGLSSGVQQTGDLITLPYVESELIVQPYASRTEKLNPFLKFGWYGQVKLTPSTDTWISTERRPDVTIDGGTLETVRYKNERDSLGTVWNNWETVWTGNKKVESSTKQQVESSRWDGEELTGTVSYSNQVSYSVNEQKTGIKTSAVTRTQKEFVGEKVVSTSAIPWIRSKEISFSGSGFKPNTKLYAFFDDVDVTDFCTPDPIKTDATGDVSGTFTIPNSATLKFRTGKRTFKLTDNALGNLGSTYGKTAYTATGTLKELQSEFVSTRVLDIETETVSESRTRKVTEEEKTTESGTIGRKKTIQNSGGTTGGSPHVHNFTVPFISGGSNNAYIKVYFSSNWWNWWLGYYGYWGWGLGRARLYKVDSPTDQLIADSGTIRSRWWDSNSGRAYFTYEIDDPSKAGEYYIQVDSGDATYLAGNWWKYTLEYIEEVPLHPSGSIYSDPLAQSFTVDEDGGAFITGVDVYFGPEAATNTYPVRCQIRNMVNGFPGNEVVPFSDVSLPAGSISGSTDASTATKFTFDAPIFLEQGKEYCFVLLSNSEELTAWVARMGETSFPDPGIFDSRQITKQPYLGAFFKSQNNQTWEQEVNEDLKFRMYRAVFDTNATGEAVFTNLVPADDVGNIEADPHFTRLEPSPFDTTTGSNVIKIHHRNHSFKAGDTVIFDNEFDGVSDVNGIPESEVFDVNGLTVIDDPGSGDAVDVDYYYVQVTTNATDSGRTGGDGVLANEFVGYSVGYFLVDNVQTNDSDILWGFKGYNHSTNSMDANFASVEPGKNIVFDQQKVVKESDDDTAQLRATFTSSRDTQSPVVDLDRCTLLATENRANNKEDDDNSATGYNAAARYILKKVQITNPANQLKIYFDANRPSNTSINVFYKVQGPGSETKFDEQLWQLATIDDAVPVNENRNSFNEYAYTITEAEDFSVFSVKVVLRTSNKAKVPRIKNFRTIALKDVNEL